MLSRMAPTTPPTRPPRRRSSTAGCSSTCPRCSAGAACCSVVAGAGAVALLAACGGRASATASTAAGTTGTTATPPRRRPRATDRRDASCSPIPEETAGPYPGDGSNGVDVLTESGVVRSDITAELRLVDDRGRGRAADHRADGPRHGRRLRAARRRRRVPVALRPRRQLLDVHGARRELPARRAGDRRRRHGDVHQHLPGRLRGPLAAHPLRGVPEPRRGHAATPATSWRRRSSRCPRTSATSSTPPTGYEQSVRNLGAGLAGAGDNVFSDDQAVHQLATMTGSVADGYTAVAGPAPSDVPRDLSSSESGSR